ncbi:protein kinase and Mad3-BUB1-I domain-containing protein [Actinidia rufa]|uniref:Protein kinase and Mad3-BUB1-I domain-containing protein n=1 Tax=Actinidia rufa TaxID=165716 RepID=A0A7J0FLH8_9ERIC|nr:protein kinase and Mad3-BUB1-I domain-containing protein [Actinidia rufa]
MAVIARDREDNTSSVVDDLLPWLWAIKKSLDGLSSADGHGTDLDELVSNCIRTFKNDARYRNDVRWTLVLNLRAFSEKWIRTRYVHVIFALRVMGDSDSFDLSVSYINPWSISTVKDLLQKMHSQISKYEGYHPSNKAYSGKVPLSSLQKSARNKVIEIGQGGFAQVFKAYVNSNPDDVVALKIQKPAFPWEFYMYRQLDKRIPESHRPSFGFAHRLHLYSDYSILVCDYLSNGTLQDAINSNVVIGGFMEEVLCIYYTIEMLSMLETLHSAGIIHGDFKPDNLLIRYASATAWDTPISSGLVASSGCLSIFSTRKFEALTKRVLLNNCDIAVRSNCSIKCQCEEWTDDLTEHCFRDRTGPWIDQGLCLVDWGRGIDASLFPDEIKFNGDCRTSGFRCVEMQEKKPWTFQVDTYGLCVIVHMMMLHNSYMEIEKKASSDDGYVYQPKSPFKNGIHSVNYYWQVKLWKDLFTKLLNSNPNDNHKLFVKELEGGIPGLHVLEPSID